ncbi:MAG: T9SS type A sorting domain-containing protein [Ignavibacteriales bacterium]|nr:T9SS type A sorting domain-containing protein [Ignavibacteriales bacterium]
MQRITRTSVFLITVFLFSPAQDTLKYQWPVTPFDATHVITGTFCEYRNTLSSNHFHNGTDIPMADGSPIYPVMSGTVSVISPSSQSGSNAYVRVVGPIGGTTKNIAYVHIEPNPSLTVGTPVTAGVTVLGNILSGLGHTHLIDGAFDSEINALRDNGGLTPYTDTYPPKILSVRFFQDNSSVEFASKQVFGLVDIIVQIAESNGPGTPNTSSITNNGVYKSGYKILSADSSMVVYEPPAGGSRFQFDWKPNDDNVGFVFTPQSNVGTHIYILTNGSGSVGTSRLQAPGNNFFDSRDLSPGNYVAMIFAVDTRGNADTVYAPFEISAQDNIPPAQPVLKSVMNDSTNRVTVSWYPNSDGDLQGYRLYSSVDGASWTLKENETSLTALTTKVSFSNATTTVEFFRLTAVDTAGTPNESMFSDMYGTRPNAATQKVLIVDGFDRASGGSYSLRYHPFAMTAGLSVKTRFETCANEAVIDGSVQLADFDIVVWLLGDESIADESLNSTEQTRIMAYLQDGGKLFIHGSELAYDLDRPSTAPTQADRDFLHNYIKAKYVGDASSSYTVNGVNGTFFSGVAFGYGLTASGSPYLEDYPDYIDTSNGSFIAAKYANGLNAMTAYKGFFPGSLSEGLVVFLGIPFETIHSKPERDAVMGVVLEFFGVPVGVDPQNTAMPSAFVLEQNYPNPFNPTSRVQFTVAETRFVSLKVFDALGREIATLVNEEKPPGTYVVPWDASGLGSGVYFYRLTAGDYTGVRKMLFVK